MSFSFHFNEFSLRMAKEQVPWGAPDLPSATGWIED
jgi:hypothetical protein